MSPDDVPPDRGEEIDVTPEMDAALDAVWDRLSDTPDARADAIADVLGGLGVRPDDLA